MVFAQGVVVGGVAVAAGTAALPAGVTVAPATRAFKRAVVSASMLGELISLTVGIVASSLIPSEVTLDVSRITICSGSDFRCSMPWSVISVPVRLRNLSLLRPLR